MKVLIILALVMSAVACNKKSEKCTYNGVDMPCDEYRRLTKPKPTATPQQSVDEISEEHVDESEAKSCLEFAQMHYSSERINALCETPNENMGGCINSSKALGLDEEQTLKACGGLLESDEDVN